MSTGNKLYYPKTHIVNNLYTEGKQWMYEDGTEYIGYYHRYIDGVHMSGAVFQRGYSKKLIEYVDIASQPTTFEYDKLKKRINRIPPKPVYPVPNEDDYAEGRIKRYFIKRRNFTSYTDIIEINKSQYRLWKKPNMGIDETFYMAIELNWKLTGPMHDIVTGLNTEYGVYDTNFRTVKLYDSKFAGLMNFLTDYTELSIYSTYVDKKYKELFG